MTEDGAVTIIQAEQVQRVIVREYCVACPNLRGDGCVYKPVKVKGVQEMGDKEPVLA